MAASLAAIRRKANSHNSRTFRHAPVESSIHDESTVWQADSEKAARQLAQKWIQDYRQAGYDRAADCLEKDLDRGVTFYPFPEAHGSHLRTSNPIESIFHLVRLRTKAARRFKKTQSGVWLVHQGIERLAKRWRRLCSSHLCGTVPLPGRQVLVAMPA